MNTADKHAQPLTSSRDTGPQLLIEWKPAYRVFFSNLFDIFLFRVVRRVAIASKPAPFWPDVFVQSATPWWGLTESALWHVIMIGAVLILWRDTPLPEQARFQRTYQPVVYYDPPPTFPVEGSRRPPEPAALEQSRKPEPPAMRVARERARSQTQQGPAAPPDLKTKAPGSPNIAGSNPLLPSVPFSSTTRSQLNAPAGATSVVAPAPDIQQAGGPATTRRPDLLQASIIPPAPDLGVPGLGAGRRTGIGTVPSATVIGPPPTLRGAGRGLGNSNVDINIGPAQVAGPSPQLPMHDRRVGSGTVQGVLGTAGLAVPPAPSLPRSGTLAGGRADSSLGGGGTGLRAVPPPPSMQGAGNSAGSGRVGEFSGQGVQVVPPPPSVQAAGNGVGGRSGSLSGVGLQAVPPAPSMQGAGSRGGGAAVGSLSGVGMQVVPPPPSAEGARGAGGGRAGSLSGNGMQAVPPPPSMQGEGSSGVGRLGSLAGNGSQVVPPAPSGLGGGGVGSGRIGSLSGDGSQIVPPPPSGVGEGGAGGGRAGALGSADVQGLPPPSAGGTGSAAAGGNLMTDNSPDGGGPGSPGAKDQPNDVDAQDMPVRLIGLALALPGSSYFSNYEVFIAERQLGKNESQFIKLVYISLPYQRRLSEYNPSHVKVFKLRVTRDKSCDETVQQMTQSQAADAQPGSPYAEALADLSSIDPNRKLPCYRTTADDYRRAVSRSR